MSSVSSWFLFSGCKKATKGCMCVIRVEISGGFVSTRRLNTDIMKFNKYCRCFDRVISNKIMCARDIGKTHTKDHMNHPDHLCQIPHGQFSWHLDPESRDDWNQT